MNDEDDAPEGTPKPALAEPRGERIAKWLARAGIASRRDAERLIAEGKVKLNGQTVETPATFVTTGDRIVVDGKPVAAPERTRLFRYHKPDGLVTTHRDPQGRTTVFEKLPPGLPRVVSIGRLDITSEGLLLLTNDGELARRLELPSNAWLRRYRVRVHGQVDERALANLARGVSVDGVAYGPIEAGLDSRQGANSWLTVSLKEGKNREVRRIMAHLGLQVTRLIRVAYGPFQLGALPRGGVEEVHPRILREQLGIGEKPVRHRGAQAAPEPPAPEPKPPTPTPPRSRTIPRARNAEPRRPSRASRHRRPPSRP
jgi:23S rRNA pseudouridine2605 synthase